MKKLLLFTAFFSLFAIAVFAQAPPPPPPAAPDYNPKGWKEYSFENDNVRFKFPAEPKVTETTSGSVKAPTRIYERHSLMSFFVMVSDSPSGDDTEARSESTNLIQKMRDGALERVKDREPKVLEESDVRVDGHPGRFLKVETKDGLVSRMKFFVVKNRIYIAMASVQKGQKHGFNWENDFEIPAMAFLDSIRIIAN